MKQNNYTETVAAATFPIAIQTRLKHGMLVTALMARDWNQTQTAKFIGVGVVRFNGWINLKAKPRHLTEEQITKLYELTGSSLDELWPQAVFTPDFLSAPKTLRAMREVPVHLLASYGIIRTLPPRPDEEFELTEMKGALQEALNRLPPRLHKILASKFLDDRSLSEVARENGISVTRVRQLIMKAIRHLRTPFPENRRLREIAR